MAVMSGLFFGKEFLDAIGVKLKLVRDVKLHMPVDGAVTLLIEKYLSNEEGEKIKLLLEEYEFEVKKTS